MPIVTKGEIEKSIDKMQPREVSILKQTRDKLMATLNQDLDQTIDSRGLEVFLKNPMCTAAVQLLPSLNSISDTLDLILEEPSILPAITNDQLRDHLIKIISNSYKTLWALDFIKEAQLSAVKVDVSCEIKNEKSDKKLLLCFHDSEGLHIFPEKYVDVELYTNNISVRLNKMYEGLQRALNQHSLDSRYALDTAQSMASSVKNLTLLVDNYIVDSQRAVKKGSEPISKYPSFLLTEKWLEQLKKMGIGYPGFGDLDAQRIIDNGRGSSMIAEFKKKEGFTTEFVLDIQY